MRRLSAHTLIASAAAAMLAMPAPAATSGAPSPALPQGGPARGLPDTALSPLSVNVEARGEALLAKGDIAAAADSFESALAADPRNIRAYVGLARVAEAQGLPGAAIGWYRRALTLDPANRDVLQLQGEAMARRGARARAEANLGRLRELCGTAACPQADRLAAALAHPATPGQSSATAAAASPPQP